MRLAIVPARGGSKRIPRKNVKSFADRPMITWVIEELLSSSVFDEVIVSTDDEEIASIAKSAHAQVPFMRPSNLADDFATTGAVVAHALEKMKLDLREEEVQVCTVYPTAVFVDRSDFEKSLKIYEQLIDGFVLAVGEYSAPIERSMTFDNDEYERFVAHSGLTRTQDLPKRYFDAGQFYWSSKSMWKRWELGARSPVRPYLLPKWKTHDIDTMEDFEFAELVFRASKNLRS